MDVLYFIGKGNPSKHLLFFLPSEMMGVVVASLLIKLTLFFFFSQSVVSSTVTASVKVSNIMNGPVSSRTTNSASVLASELVLRAFATTSMMSWVATGCVFLIPH